MGSGDRDSEQLPRPDVARRLDPADHGRPRSPDRRVELLRAPGSELHDHIILDDLLDAARLRRDERLVVDDVQERRLDELRLDERRLDPDERLVSEHDFPLHHRIDVTGKPELRQIRQEVFPVTELIPQIADIALCKPEFPQISERPLQPRKNGIAVPERQLAEIKIKDRLPLMDAVRPIRLRHVDLIQVGMEHQAVICILRRHENPFFRNVVCE